MKPSAPKLILDSLRERHALAVCLDGATCLSKAALMAATWNTPSPRYWERSTLPRLDLEALFGHRNFGGMRSKVNSSNRLAATSDKNGPIIHPPDKPLNPGCPIYESAAGDDILMLCGQSD